MSRNYDLYLGDILAAAYKMWSLRRACLTGNFAMTQKHSMLL
jgi:hypothetical protein